MIKRLVSMAATVLAVCLPLAAQSAAPGYTTVNQFTSDEANRALKAATEAGYRNPVISWYQGGNFFIIAAGESGLHRLTVTLKGEVIPGPAGQYVLPLYPVLPVDKPSGPSS